ncbi:fungal hydrophobin [Trametes punicea]|nr:fungal hydrophobin [Trametes punicea]
MVARIASALVTLVAAAAVGAIAVPRSDNQCNTGAIQCCNQSDSAEFAQFKWLFALLNLDDVTGLAGVDCTPISVLGAAGNSCQATPVCCENNSVGGLVNVGCVPIEL